MCVSLHLPCRPPAPRSVVFVGCVMRVHVTPAANPLPRLSVCRRLERATLYTRLAFGVYSALDDQQVDALLLFITSFPPFLHPYIPVLLDDYQVLCTCAILLIPPRSIISPFVTPVARRTRPW